jgi:hypothetical protein
MDTPACVRRWGWLALWLVARQALRGFALD